LLCFAARLALWRLRWRRRLLGRLAFENQLQVSGERSRRLVALVGLLGERTLDDGVDHRRDLHERRRRDRIALHDLHREAHARALERLLPGEELVEEDACREDVGAPIDRLALD